MLVGEKFSQNRDQRQRSTTEQLDGNLIWTATEQKVQLRLAFFNVHPNANDAWKYMTGMVIKFKTFASIIKA